MASASHSPTILQVSTTNSEKTSTLPAKPDKTPEKEVKEQYSQGVELHTDNKNKVKSSSTKPVSSLINAMQFFGKMAGKPNTENSNQQNQDTEDNSKKEPSGNALRVFGRVAAVPSLLAEKVKATQTEQLKSGELLNLTFLEEHEIVTIQKVIQADLKLRKDILGSLRKSIDQAQQSQTEDTLEQSKPGLSCAVCGLGVTTICSRVFATKCSDCGRVVCKNCARKQAHEFSTVCLPCKKRRNLQLQTLDYESILHYGNDASESIPLYAESELVKKSLQATFKTQRSVEFMSGNINASRTLPKSSKGHLESLAVPDQQRPSSAMQLPISRQSKLKKVASLDLETKSKSLSIPRISDADCGYKLMAKASDESLVDMCSVYSEQCYFGVEISGRILLGLWYKSDEKRLYIRIVKAENLADAADGALDPYVKTYLLPGVYKSNKRKTGLQYDTTKPAWNEVLKYADLTQEEVRTKTLWVSVWDWNRYGRQQFLGEVHIALNNRDLTNSKDEWFQLRDSESKPRIETEEVDSPEQEAKPRVLIGLNFDPYTPEELARLRSDKKGKLGCLRIKLRRAENLPAMDIHNRTDSFVRCYLLPNKQLGGKKKSKLIEDSLNPIWEEEIFYTFVSLEELQAERALEVTLWDFDRRGTNQFIGGVKIGPNPFDVIHTFDWMDSMESESNHWEDMIDKPGEWTEAWHTLRPSMDSLHTLKEKIKIHEGSISSGSLPIETTENNSCRDTPVISSPVPPQSSSETNPDQTLEVNISRPGKGHYKISGEVLIGIKFKDGFLYVKVVKAAGLTAVHRNGTSNPYIKVYLLPDRSKESKKKTEIKKRTINPVYKQAFKYQVSEEEIQTKTLWVTVWNHDSIGANLFMGETCISLAGNLRHSVERWYELHDFAECGMVVMATPFGHTPQKYLETQPALDLKLSDHSEGVQEEQGEDTPPQDIPEVKVEDTPPKDSPEVNVEDTPPKDIPEVKVVDTET